MCTQVRSRVCCTPTSQSIHLPSRSPLISDRPAGSGYLWGATLCWGSWSCRWTSVARQSVSGWARPLLLRTHMSILCSACSMEQLPLESRVPFTRESPLTAQAQRLASPTTTVNGQAHHISLPFSGGPAKLGSPHISYFARTGGNPGPHLEFHLRYSGCAFVPSPFPFSFVLWLTPPQRPHPIPPLLNGLHSCAGFDRIDPARSGELQSSMAEQFDVDVKPVLEALHNGVGPRSFPSVYSPSFSVNVLVGCLVGLLSLPPPSMFSCPPPG